MPKIRNRVDAHGSAFSSQRASPLLSSSLGSVTRDPSAPLFPDVPLNPQHRYSTPPPLDTTFAEQSTNIGVGFRPNMLTRDPSISDYLSLFEEPPTQGSQENPITLDDTNQGTRQPHRTAGGKEVAEAQAAPTPRRSPRSDPQTSTARRASSRTQGKPYPTTSPNSSPTSTASSSRRAQPKTKKSAAGRKAPGKTPGARKKAAANKFAPSVSSPLSRTAFTASARERTLSPTPPPAEVHGRWYIPPRQHSTGSISAPSESSSDSDSEPDYGAMYYA